MRNHTLSKEARLAAAISAMTWKKITNKRCDKYWYADGTNRFLHGVPITAQYG